MSHLKMAAPRVAACGVPPNARKKADFGRNVRSNNVNGFDMRKWRNSQYKKNLGNVEEGQGFADRRKREIARQYAKQTRRDRQQMAQDIGDGGQRPQSMTPTPPHLRSESFKTSNGRRFDQSVKMDSFQKARFEHKERMDAKEKKLQEIHKSREERDAALNRYKKKKVERRKKLLKYTKKGQPVMKGRIELLLETLQRQSSSYAVK